MSTTAPSPHMTPEEYLALERSAETKSEYLDGEVFAMAGVTRAHSLIAGDVHAALHGQLAAGPCEVHMADMRVKVSETGLYTYPDVVVACGKVGFEDEHTDTLLNPTVVIEVLSPSTEAYDRGLKFSHYRRLPSLQDYLLIAQDRVSVEHFARREGQWLLTEQTDLNAVVDLAAIGCRLALVAVYARVEHVSSELPTERPAADDSGEA